VKKQEPLPLDGVIANMPRPCWPRQQADYRLWADRGPDPAAFAAYLGDQLYHLCKGVVQWSDRYKPERGWAVVENAPELDPIAYVLEHLTEAATMLGILAADAHDSWEADNG